MQAKFEGEIWGSFPWTTLTMLGVTESEVPRLVTHVTTSRVI